MGWLQPRGPQDPVPPSRRDVTREFVEARLGSDPSHPLLFVGTKRSTEPRRGHVCFDEDTGEQYMYTGAEWQVLASGGYDYDHRQPGAWCCAYCGTHFGEQRCPTCGAGRTEG